MNSSGYIADIFERSTITNGGYLCKKFKTASYPSTVGYNLAYCFLSLGNGGSCPTGWTAFNPGSGNFCYYPINSYYTSHDEIYRQCHALGADLAYIESTTEFNMMSTNGWMDTSLYMALNGNRFRYGPFGIPNSPTALSWSNGAVVANPGTFGFSWCGGNPDNWCTTESALQYIYCGLNDITPYLNLIGSNTNLAMIIGVCKRPQCGILTQYIIPM